MKCVCGSTEEHINPLNDEHICKNCGRVKQGRAFESSLSFSNQNVLGKFGRKGGEFSNIKSIYGMNRDADEIRLSKAYKLIDHLSSLLNLKKITKEVKIQIFFKAKISFQKKNLSFLIFSREARDCTN